MKLSAFKDHLQRNADKHVGFVFDDGEAIPGHFHVTEVGHVAKNFIDCGGTVRSVSTAQLQIWLGNDEEHRLSAGKLAKIIDLAQPILPSNDLDVEIEYEGCVISQYTVEGATATGEQVVFEVADKHTDCLAKEACGLEAAARPGEPASAGCCGGSGCC